MRDAVEFTVSALAPFRVLDKLRTEGVEIFRARPRTKNVLTFEVARQNEKKVFAILRGSCYNVVKTRPRGRNSLRKACLSAAGLVAGLFLFCGIVLFFESRVLRVEIVGSGACYEAEVRALLKEKGIGFLSAAPKNAEEISARVLSFPRVNYCSLSHAGGVLTVEIVLGDESAAYPAEPLLSPADGTVEELVVVRGAPLVAPGDRVEAGQTLVSSTLVEADGRERTVIVIAYARIATSVSEEFEGSREEALLRAEHAYGALTETELTQTEKGWLVRGIAHVSVSLHFG